jgi:Mg2+/Co2+ transporter CorB
MRHEISMILVTDGIVNCLTMALVAVFQINSGDVVAVTVAPPPTPVVVPAIRQAFAVVMPWQTGADANDAIPRLGYG